MIIIISGPQGVGKTTIVNEFLKRNQNFSLSVSYTTRGKRKDEKNGVEYEFVSIDKFNELETSNFFMEVISFNGNKYATPISNIKAYTILNVTASAIENFLNILQDQTYITIFLTADFDEIINRLKGRQDEDVYNKIKEINHQMSYKNKFQYIIENHNINDTIEQIEEIIRNKIV